MYVRAENILNYFFLVLEMLSTQKISKNIKNGSDGI